MRSKTLVLTRRDISRVVDMPSTIRTVREAFKEYAHGRAIMPCKIYLPLPQQSDFRAMPAFLRRRAACGIKWVNVHPRNRARRLPTVMAVIVINDSRTGRPIAVLDGLLITKLRTAAAGAVAARALARPESTTVGLVGCGAQADTQLVALSYVMRLRRVKVWGFFSGEAARFCRRMRYRLSAVAFEACRNLEACVREADVVTTITPSRRPIVKYKWLSPGTHINAMGADAAGKQELEPKILSEGRVVVDEREQAIHGGELNVAIREGRYSARKIAASLGDVLIGRRVARRSAKEITVFDSTGLAIHDVALGHEVVKRARQQGIGRRIEMFA